MKRALTIAVGVSAACRAGAALHAEERIDADINAKIRQEGQNNSQDHAHPALPDRRLRPALTGSPNLKAAGEWAIKQMASWGFTNGHLEPWDFGRPGWTNDVAIGAIVAPVRTSSSSKCWRGRQAPTARSRRTR